MKLRGLLTTLLLTIMAVALTVLTVVFAPLPLLLVRRNGGRKSFALATTLGLFIFAVLNVPSYVAIYGGVCLMAYIFSECENQSMEYSLSALITVLAVAGYSAIAVGIAADRFGFDPIAFMHEQIQQGLAQLNLPPSMKMDQETILNQVPSGALMVLVFMVWINSILVRRLEFILSWIPAHVQHIYILRDFTEWKLPDEFVWVALASVAGSFIDFKMPVLKIVATNVLNVAAMLYFFQGLAIVVNFFTFKRVGPVWRVLAYFLIFTQLFMFVAVLGFTDLWLGFRNRFKADSKTVA